MITAKTPVLCSWCKRTPTPDNSLIAGDLVSQLESKIGQPGCAISGICPALNKLAGKEGWNTNPPPGIHALGDATNTANFETFATGDNRQGMLLAGLMEQNPSLRKNLNIVQADWFDEMYSPLTTTVIPSPYVADMIKPEYASAGVCVGRITSVFSLRPDWICHQPHSADRNCN